MNKKTRFAILAFESKKQQVWEMNGYKNQQNRVIFIVTSCYYWFFDNFINLKRPRYIHKLITQLIYSSENNYYFKNQIK